MTYDEACTEARKGLGAAGWPNAAKATCADIVTHLRNNPALFACPDQTRVTLVGCSGGGTPTPGTPSTGTPAALPPTTTTGVSGAMAWISANPVTALIVAAFIGYMLKGRN